MELNHEPVKTKQATKQTMSKATKTVVIISSIFGGITLILIIILLTAAFSSFNEFGKTYTKQPSTETPQTIPVDEKPSSVYPFNLPTLLTQDIDQIRQTLGQPEDSDPEPTAQQINGASAQWWNTFEKDGEELLVTFDATTRELIDLFISGDDKQALLKKTELEEYDSRYTLEFVKALSDPSAITGVTITPK